MRFSRKFFLVAILAAAVVSVVSWYRPPLASPPVSAPFGRAILWQFQSIDTMKFSRDLAREKFSDQGFDRVIDEQVRNIVATGATHVAIGTPYDEEFLPYLRRWVAAARRYNLNVWYRGNWSGWEEWFGYSRIGRAEHLKKTEQFIVQHTELFRDGDLFTPCPECENGGPGDPRMTGDVAGYREFLIEEYRVSSRAFRQIGRNVQSNLASMNADVALLVMDRPTTRALGGIVTLDHYALSAEEYATIISRISERSGGKIVIGEFGAPIPKLHGHFTPEQQEEWLAKTLQELASNTGIVGVNYWVAVGGSTSLWDAGARPRPAVNTLTSFYRPPLTAGVVRDELYRSLWGVEIRQGDRVVYTDQKGFFEIASLPRQDLSLSVSRAGYASQRLAFSRYDEQFEIQLIKEHKNIFFQVLISVKNFLKKLRNPF